MKLFFALFLFTSLIATHVDAAVVSVNVPAQIHRGDRVSVDIAIDPQNESINSMDIGVAFPTTLFTFSGYQNQSTTFPLWIAAPHEEAGVVRFSGVIPGGIERGYDPQHPQNQITVITRLYFTATAAGVGTFTIVNPELLKNDGLGTAIATTVVPTSVTVVDAGPNIPAQDTIAPNPFVITILAKSAFGKTPQLAIFSAQDDQSGVSYYKAQIGHGAWNTVASPYPLLAHPFTYRLTVRAYDFSGNYQEERVEVPGQQLPKLMILLAIVILGTVSFLIYRRRYTLSV